MNALGRGPYNERDDRSHFSCTMSCQEGKRNVISPFWSCSTSDKKMKISRLVESFVRPSSDEAFMFSYAICERDYQGVKVVRSSLTKSSA